MTESFLIWRKVSPSQLRGKIGISGQDGGAVKHGSPPRTNTAKITTKLQNNYYYPELPENQAVWKSNNQGIKGVAFIQMGRRGGDTWRCGIGGPTPMCGK